MIMDYFEYTLPNGLPARICVNTHQSQQVPVQLIFNYSIYRTVLLNVLVTEIKCSGSIFIQIVHRGKYYHLKWLGNSDGYYRGFALNYDEAVVMPLKFKMSWGVENPVRQWLSGREPMTDNLNMDLIVVSSPFLSRSGFANELVPTIRSTLIKDPEITDRYYEIVCDSNQFEIQPHRFNESITFPTWEELTDY